jgi:hypothetical protein
MSAGVGRVQGASAGVAGGGAGTVVLESAGQLGPLLETDLVTDRTIVFAPGVADGSRVVGYEGSFGEPGAEFTLGDTFYLQIQNYAISEYVSVVGPTLVRVADEVDFEAYLTDADRAVREGVFPQFLTNPVIQLADLPALGAGIEGDGPDLRLYVRSSGALTTSPSGADFGSVGDRLPDLMSRWTALNNSAAAPCAVCLASALDEAERSRALTRRPWLGRYLAAVEAIRDVRARGIADPQVSGFGRRLVPDLPLLEDAADGVDPAAAVLLWAGEEAFIYHPGSARTFRVPLSTARIAETLLACGSTESAAGRLPQSHVRQVADMLAAQGVPWGADALATTGRAG